MKIEKKKKVVATRKFIYIFCAAVVMWTPRSYEVFISLFVVREGTYNSGHNGRLSRVTNTKSPSLRTTRRRPPHGPSFAGTDASQSYIYRVSERLYYDVTFVDNQGPLSLI